MELLNNTYTEVARSDPKDKLEVEVGDILQSDFYPQVKLKRWDNEVNISLRLAETLTGSTHTEANGVITWDKGFIHARFYTQPDTITHPEGGYEFEVVIDKKPSRNYVDFTLNTKGLEFCFQPALTAEEITGGATRPENVVNSYAVYFKDCPANRIGGKTYRSGKAFHIYRPHVVDSVGNQTWADLTLDEVAGTLRISIPQTWLNTAKYPITVDPTFGYTTQGATQNSGSGNTMYGSMYNPTVSADATVDSVSFYGKANTTGNFKGIVVDSAFAILTNGVSGGKAMTASNGWNTVDYTSKPSLSNASYYPTFITDAANNFYYDTGTGNNRFVHSNSYSSPTNPTSKTLGTAKYSIYATYSAGDSPVNAPVTQVYTSVATSGGTQTVTSVQNASITQTSVSLTTSLGTQEVTTPTKIQFAEGAYYWRVRAKAPAGSNTWGNWTTGHFDIASGAVNASITQVAANVAISVGTQVVNAVQKVTASISQVFGQVSLSTGVAVVAGVAIVSASIGQVSTTLAVTGGSQGTNGESEISINQTDAHLTISTGTQSVSANSMSATEITQVSADLGITGGTQSVDSSRFITVSQVAKDLTISGITPTITSSQKTGIVQIASELDITTFSPTIESKMVVSIEQVCAELTISTGTQEVAGIISDIYGVDVSQVSASMSLVGGENSVLSFIPSGNNPKNILVDGDMAINIGGKNYTT